MIAGRNEILRDMVTERMNRSFIHAINANPNPFGFEEPSRAEQRKQNEARSLEANLVQDDLMADILGEANDA